MQELVSAPPVLTDGAQGTDLPARRMGLIDLPLEQVTAAGNTALLGAKLALFSMDGEDGSYARLRQKIEHVALKADAKFQDAFVEGLSFPQHFHVHG